MGNNRLEAVKTLLRVATVFKMHGEDGDLMAAMIGKTSVMSASKALEEMTAAGLTTLQQGKDVINESICRVMDPSQHYGQAEFDTDREFLDANIGLIIGEDNEPAPAEVAETIAALEQSYITK